MKRPCVAVAAMCVIVLVVFLLLSACAFPNYDDYRIANVTRSVGVVEMVSRKMAAWSSRYFAYGLEGVLVAIGGLYGIYPVAPALMLAATWFATWRLILASSRPRADPKRALAAAGIANLFYVATMPNLSEGYYWLAASTAYIAPLALALLLFALLLGEPERESAWRRAGRIAGCVLAVLCIGGANEILLALVGMLLAVLTFHRWKGKERRLVVTVAFLLLGACAVLAFFGPGTTARLDREGTRDVLHSVGRAAIMPVGFFLRWSLNPAVWGLTILALPVLPRIAEWFPKARPRRMLLAWCVFMFVLVFLCYWSLGRKPEGRIRNVLYAAHLVWWVPFVAGWLGGRAPSVLRPKTQAIAVVLVLLGMFGVGRAGRMVWEASGPAWSYRRRFLERDEMARRQVAAGRRRLVLPSVLPIPSSVEYRQMDVGLEERLWKRYAVWCGADEVRFVPRPP